MAPNFADPAYGMPGILGGWAQPGGILGNYAGATPAPPAPAPPAPSGALGGWQTNPILTALGSSLLANRGALGPGLATFGQMAPQAIADQRKRTALNAWLKAKSSGDAGALDKATQNLYIADPGIAESVVSAQMTPHPSQLTYNPVTGAAGTFEPYSGVYTPQPSASAGGGGSGAFPPGFIFGGAKPYTDASSNETGLIDVNGVKAVIGKANPNSDQSKASAAADLARQANALVKTSEKGQTGFLSTAERLAMKLPLAGPMISGPEARSYEDGKQQFLQAIRSLAISAKLNPESAEYTEQALFPGQNATPEEIKQKDTYRETIISNLERQAGPFAQQQGAGQPQPQPVPVATPPQAAVDFLKVNPSLGGAFDQKYGKGAAAQILGQ